MTAAGGGGLTGPPSYSRCSLYFAEKNRPQISQPSPGNVMRRAPKADSASLDPLSLIVSSLMPENRYSDK